MNPLARNTDPDTSHEAAQRIRTCGEVERCKRDVENALHEYGPMIPADLAKLCGRDYVAIQRRGAEMEREGRIIRYRVAKQRQSTWSTP